MNHPTFTQISAALDGQAAGSQGESVRHHMGICPGCRDWRDQLAEESLQLRELLVNEPEPEFFDELFDGIEAAIRADLLEDTGPKPVAVKRSLLGLARKSAPDTPSGQTPRPSGATPRPSGATPRPTGGSPTPVSGATPRPVERAGPRADAGTAPQRDGKRTDDHAPAPPREAPRPVSAQAPRPVAPSRETPRPPSDGIERPPVMQVPSDVKPSSAELVRPGPPLFVPPPAPPTPAERDAIPFTHIVTPPHSRGDLHKLAPGDDIGLPEQPTVDTTPAWSAAADDVRTDLPPTLAPHIFNAPGAVTPATPHSRSFPRPLSRGLPKPETSASIPSRATPRPDEFAPTPSRTMPHPAAHDAPVIEESAYEPPPSRPAPQGGEGIRITYRELVVVFGALIAFTLIGLGIMRFNRARNAERARHLIEVATPAPAATEPTEPVIPAPAPPSRNTRADKARNGANATPARTTTREPAGTRTATPPARTAEPRNETPARQAAPVTPAPTPARATPAPAAPAPAARTEAASASDEASWPLLCGQVLDDQNLPVSGARVLLADLDLGARTDRNGRFCLSAPPGDRTLSVVALGFKTYRQGIQITESPAELHVVLHGTQ